MGTGNIPFIVKQHVPSHQQVEARAALSRLAQDLEFNRAFYGAHHEHNERAVSTWTTLWHQAWGAGVQVDDPPLIYSVIEKGEFHLA